MNKKLERIKFYRSLKKKANLPPQATLFELYRQTKEKDGTLGDPLKPNTTTNQTGTGSNQSSSSPSSPSSAGPQNLSNLKELGTRYELVDENGAPSKYVKDGDFISMKFTEIVALYGNKQLKTVFIHYYNEKNPNSSYFQVVKTSEGYTADLSKKYTHTDEVYKNLMKNSLQWNYMNKILEYQKKNMLDPAKEKDEAKYKVRKGTQADTFKEEYSKQLIKELEESGSDIKAREEAVQEWLDNKTQEELDMALKAIEDKVGIGYKLTEADKEILSNTKEHDISTQGTEPMIQEERKSLKSQYTYLTKLPEVEMPRTEESKQALPKRNKTLYKADKNVRLHSKFDKIPDGLGNYRGGALYGKYKFDVKGAQKQFKLLKEKYGIKRVIKLNGDEYLTAAQEKKICEDLGMEHYLVDAHYDYIVGQGYVGTIAITNRIFAMGNVYVHCSGGMDRAGYTTCAWLKKLRGITNNDIQSLEELYAYCTQYNSWNTYICNVGTMSTVKDKKTGEKKKVFKHNNGYGKYLEGFYPMDLWCKAKKDRLDCRVCGRIDRLYPKNKKKDTAIV